MHLNTYVRMILDVLSNLRMPERKKCQMGLLGGPWPGEVYLEEGIGRKQPKSFPTKQKHFQSSYKKSFYSVANVRRPERRITMLLDFQF